MAAVEVETLGVCVALDFHGRVQELGAPMRLDDSALDSCAPEVRDKWLVEAIRNQITYMCASVPFWEDRFTKANVEEKKIECLADLSQVPILTKAEFRATPPVQLLPDEALSKIKVGRWTSGTTGRPTVNFWSETDWSALVASLCRILQRQAPMRRPIAFNAFSQGHVTGPLFNAALRRLGAVVYDRSHHPEEQFSTLAQTELFDFDTLVLPAQSARGKGVGLINLLDDDPSFLLRNGVRWWMGSSGTFDTGLVNRVQEQGVQIISNLYGSSEFAPFALSCPENPGEFHVAQGHILAEVVDQSGRPVESGQFGGIVVTHLRGMNDNGQACLHEGTQILRLAAGDGATVFHEPCVCGLTTPRLRDIRRIGSPD
jgi:phenylacetate-CoA ligase